MNNEIERSSGFFIGLAIKLTYTTVRNARSKHTKIGIQITRTSFTPGQVGNVTTPEASPTPQTTNVQSTPDRTVRSETSSPIPATNVTPAQVVRSAPKVKPQVNAALKNLTPEQRNRYLNTNMSVDGKTDLGLDDFDRRVLGLGGGIPGVKVKKIEISPYSPKSTSSDRTVAIEQSQIKSSDTQRASIQAERTGIQQQLKYQPFNDSLKALDRKLEEDNAVIAIQNEEAANKFKISSVG
jgi:hypothetical protein